MEEYKTLKELLINSENSGALDLVWGSDLDLTKEINIDLALDKICYIFGYQKEELLPQQYDKLVNVLISFYMGNLN